MKFNMETLRNSRISRKDTGIYNIIRTIHPVGQGALYRESFYNSASERVRTVLYDCGSSPVSYVNTEIKSSFIDGDVIDLLFLSHFDYDHVSGLPELRKHCKIDMVVMPLFNSVQKMYMLVQGIDKLLITDPEAYFKGAKIVFVLPSDSKGTDPTDEEMPYDELPEIIASASIIRMPVDVDWAYIPFNYESSTRIEQFRNLFKEIPELSDVDFDDENQVNELIKNADRRLIGKINNVFRQAFPDGANKISMILYSGPAVSSQSILTISENKPVCAITPDGQHRNEAAALYTGDTDLHQNNIIADLKSHLKGLDVNLGIVQLPHHGSIKNFTKDIWNRGRTGSSRLYFAAYGTTNRYGHPSYDVVQETLVNHTFIPVTEKRNSALIQIIIK